MIKTHRPRGHFWTCTSLFQESKQFCEITYEDCATVESPVIAADPDEQLSDLHRAAKRQRIEKIAHEFMLGEPIRLASTAFRPHTLKATVEWNQRSLTEQSFTLSANQDDGLISLAQSDNDHQAGEAKVEQHMKKAGDKVLDLRSSGKAAHNQAVMIASSNSMKSLHVLRREPAVRSSRPSEDALAKAAALRRTRISEAGFEAPNSEPCSDVVRHASSTVSRYPTRRSTISLRDNCLDSAGPGCKTVRAVEVEDDSADELRLSRCEAHFESPNTVSDMGQSTSSAEVHSATVLADADTPSGASLAKELSPSDAKLPKWATANSRGIAEGLTENVVHRKTCEIDQYSSVRSSMKAAKQAETDPAVCLDPKSALAGGGDAPGYIVAPTPSDGSTPFVYRKRVKKLGRIGKEKANAETTGDVLARQLLTPCHPATRSTTIVEKLSGSRAAQSSDTPLVDAHLNTVFTCTAETADSRSSLQKALRRELRNSGARVTDTAGDVLASSPVTPLIKDNQAYTAAKSGVALDVVEPLSWAGTQNLLQQAEKELLSMSHVDLTGGDDPDTDSHKPEPGTEQHNERVLLRELPQAPQDSVGTQTLVEAWSPWSTVKKPLNREVARSVVTSPWSEAQHSVARVASAAPPEDSPAVKKPLARRRLDHSSRQQLCISKRRSSTTLTNLGFSVQKPQSFTVPGSPKTLPGTNSDAGINAQDSHSPQNDHFRSTSATLRDIATNHQDADCPTSGSTMTTTYSTGAPLPSYEAAQLPEDESQIQGIIHDLTTSLLRTDDMCGVLVEI